MKSYKNWKLVNESVFPLGIRQTHNVGGLQNPFGQYVELEEAAKKKMHDNNEEEDDGHSCQCNKKMKKQMKDKKGKDMWKDGDKTPVGDQSGKMVGGMPHNKKKKMTKKMGDDDMKDMGMMMKKKKPHHVHPDDEEELDGMPHDDDDDVEDDDLDGDEDGVDDDMDGDADDMDDDGDEVDDVVDDKEDDMDDHEAKKYNFMKKKMQKKMKKKMREAKDFDVDISKYPAPPEDHSQDTEAEFFASLTRQFGNPGQRFASGLSEDLLIPLNDPNAPNYQAPAVQPGPGEVGYAPQGRIGEMPDYAAATEEATEYNVLKKYFGESAARKAIKDNK